MTESKLQEKIKDLDSTLSNLNEKCQNLIKCNEDLIVQNKTILDTYKKTITGVVESVKDTVFSPESFESKNFSKSVYDELVLERYKVISKHLGGLTETARSIFFLFTKLFIIGVAAQIALFSSEASAFFEKNTVFYLNQIIFVVLLGLSTLFSLQILFCLYQWHTFRKLQSNLFDNNKIPTNSHIKAPNLGNWLFEISFVASFFVGMILSGALVTQAKIDAEFFHKAEVISECFSMTLSDDMEQIEKMIKSNDYQGLVLTDSDSNDCVGFTSGIHYLKSEPFATLIDERLKADNSNKLFFINWAKLLGYSIGLVFGVAAISSYLASKHSA